MGACGERPEVRQQIAAAEPGVGIACIDRRKYDIRHVRSASGVHASGSVQSLASPQRNEGPAGRDYVNPLTAPSEPFSAGKQCCPDGSGVESHPQSAVEEFAWK